LQVGDDEAAVGTLSEAAPRMENRHSTWLSQEAWVGVKWE
jgi:hypothetical protein